MGVAGDVSYTCETAAHFFLYQVAPRWDQFHTQVKTASVQVHMEAVTWSCNRLAIVGRPCHVITM